MIQEGNIKLSFDGNIIKYDDSNFYRSRVEKCKDTKAVDLLALNIRPLLLIEIKDFRNFRIENKMRISNGDLADEFSKKIRDTISGLYGAYRHNNEDLKVYYEYFFNQKDNSAPIKGILLLEEDLSKDDKENKKRKITKRELKTKIEQLLSFLSIHVFILDQTELTSEKGWSIS